MSRGDDGGKVACAALALYGAAGTVVRGVLLVLSPLLRRLQREHGIEERLGRIPAAVRALNCPVWVHAASVGEVLAASALIEQLRQHWPDRPVLLTTTSLTGRDTARARAGADAVMLLPLDVGAIVARVMRTVQPSILVLVETELWPALIRAAAGHGVPCVMVSGRVSAAAAARYAWVRPVLRSVLAQVRAFAMQTEADAERIRALGAPPERVQVLGNLKFARARSNHPVASGLAVRLTADRLLLVAASTHPGEEAMVLQACGPLWEAYPGLLLLVAPRRPERFDEVSALLKQSGNRTERRSNLQDPVASATRVLLLDTVGELPDFLSLARAVFVGGTMLPVGGHNVLEPAVFGKPVAFGPYTQNVAAAAAALLEAGGGTRVHNSGELRTLWSELLQRPEVAARMGGRARQVVAANAAVAERTFEVVRRCAAQRQEPAFRSECL